MITRLRFSSLFNPSSPLTRMQFLMRSHIVFRLSVLLTEAHDVSTTVWCGSQGCSLAARSLAAEAKGARSPLSEAILGKSPMSHVKIIEPTSHSSFPRCSSRPQNITRSLRVKAMSGEYRGSAWGTPRGRWGTLMHLTGAFASCKGTRA